MTQHISPDDLVNTAEVHMFVNSDDQVVVTSADTIACMDVDRSFNFATVQVVVNDVAAGAYVSEDGSQITLECGADAIVKMPRDMARRLYAALGDVLGGAEQSPPMD